MRTLRLLTVIAALLVLTVCSAIAQQITYTDDFKFPLIPRGYKQYWDVQYNAAMNTLEVLFSRSVYRDITNTFLYDQKFNQDVRISGETTLTGYLRAYAGGQFFGPVILQDVRIDGTFTTLYGASFGGNIEALDKLSLLHNSESAVVDFSDGNTIKISIMSGISEYIMLTMDTVEGLKSEGLYKLWHENNDGEGSGLDADKIDGKHWYELVGGGDLEGKFEAAEETAIPFYDYDFGAPTGAVRFDVTIFAALKDGSSSYTGEWAFLGTKMLDGTILLSDVQQKQDFEGTHFAALQAKVDSVVFSRELYAGALIRFNVIGYTSGLADPNSFLCSWRIKTTKM